MSPFKTISLVAGREIRTRLFTKTSVLSVSIVIILIIVALSAAAYLIGNSDRIEPEKFAVTPQASNTAALIKAKSEEKTPTKPLELSLAPSKDNIKRLIADGEAVAGLDYQEDSYILYTGPETPPFIIETARNTITQLVIDAAIKDLGGDPKEIRNKIAASPLKVDHSAAETSWNPSKFSVSMTLMGLTLYLIVSTGSALATGVVEEKTSRIVEILLAAIKPEQLLAGKIIGIGAVGFAHVSLVVTAIIGGLKATRLNELLDISIDAPMLWSLLWMVLGFMLYSVLWAGGAALVSRQEDTGYITGPLMMLLFIPFYATMFLVSNSPNGITAQVLTYIPFSAPFAAPVRFTYGAISYREMAFSSLICVILIVILTLVAGRVYQRGILHMGGRLKLGTALRG